MNFYIYGRTARRARVRAVLAPVHGRYGVPRSTSFPAGWYPARRAPRPVCVCTVHVAHSIHPAARSVVAVTCTPRHRRYYCTRTYNRHHHTSATATIERLILRTADHQASPPSRLEHDPPPPPFAVGSIAAPIPAIEYQAPSRLVSRVASHGRGAAESHTHTHIASRISTAARGRERMR